MTVTVPLLDGLDSRRSWRVLVAAGLVAACGAQYLWGATIGLFLLPLEHDLGWTRAQLGIVTALTAAASFVLVPTIGWLIDRAPLRPLVITGVVGQALCIAAGGLLGGSVLWFYAQVAGIMVFGLLASLLVLSKIVRGWFDVALGKAMGALFALAALGSVINPLVAQALIERYGWRGAYLTMGCGALAITLALGMALLKERAPAVARIVEAPSLAAHPVSLRELVRHRAWWVLIAYNVFFGYAATGIAFHLAPLLQERGATARQSAVALSLSAAGALVGNLLAGAFVDRCSARGVASIVMLVPACGVMLLSSNAGVSASIAVVVLLGLSTGSEHSLVAVLSGKYFGTAIYGRAYSSQLVAASVGSGLAPWAVGLLHQRTGGYALPLAISAASLTTAAILAWLLPRPSSVTVVEHGSPRPAIA